MPETTILDEFEALREKTTNDELFQLAREVAHEFAFRADNYVQALDELDQPNATLLIEAQQFVNRADRSFVQTLSRDREITEAGYSLMHSASALERYASRVTV